MAKAQAEQRGKAGRGEWLEPERPLYALANAVLVLPLSHEARDHQTGVSLEPKWLRTSHDTCG